MASFTRGVKAQPSAASLSSSMHQVITVIDGIADADDLTIATGLLARPRIPRRRTSFSGASLGQQSLNLQDEVNGTGSSRRLIQSSNTWTTSSGEILSDHDEVDDRQWYIKEYNQLARKHGVRLMVVEDYDENDGSGTLSNKPTSWFSRNVLRRTSSTTSVRQDTFLKHRRSISDLSLRRKGRREWTKDKDLQELVRLCGACLLYLPSDYAFKSLALPTCFRATAYYLVQNGTKTKGIFRVNGATSVVESLYNHFCTVGNDGEVIAETVRMPILPDHIRCDVNDVASTFKRFLNYLPGGILGSLPLFDALVAIEGQLQGGAEFTKTKQTKVRARLIALAISTLRSQYRRDLISAVFGLLCLIGRAAEVEPREDERGRPVPTSDLMGYSQLGIVFGPLLVGGLLDNYSMRLANPTGGLVLLPVSPPRSRKERKRKKPTTEDGINLNLQVDKYKIVNTITEMLITNWRDVVRHMRNLSASKAEESKSVEPGELQPPPLRTSASETFALRRPPDWEVNRTLVRINQRAESPTPIRRTGHRFDIPTDTLDVDAVSVQRQRAKRRPKSQMLSGARSFKLLSPTKEIPSEELTSFLATPSSSINFSRPYKDKENVVVGDHTSSSKIREKVDPPSAKRKLPKHSKLSEGESEPNRKKSPSTPSKAYRYRQSSRKYSSLRGKHGFGFFSASNGDDTPLLHLHVLDTHPTSVLLQNTQILASSKSRRKASSEPSKSKKMTSRAAKSVRSEPIPRSAYATRFLNKDPLSRVPNEENMASLIEIGKVLNETAKAQEIEAQDSDECKCEHPLTHVSHEEDVASAAVPATGLSFVESSLSEPSVAIKPAPVSSSFTPKNATGHGSGERVTKSLAVARHVGSREGTPGTKFESGSLPEKATSSSEKDRIDRDSGKKKQEWSLLDIPTPSKIVGPSFLPRLNSFIRGHEKTSSGSSTSKNTRKECSDGIPKDTPPRPYIDSRKIFKDTFGARSPPVKSEQDRQHVRNTLKKPMIASSGSVKALTEKFNNQSPAKDKKPPPPMRKLNRKSISDDTWLPIHTPRKESLVAPYTMNSSPSKSQMSGKSERTPKSTRTQAFFTKPRTPLRGTDTNSVRSSSPRRILIPSEDDKKPLISIQRSFDAGDDKSASFAVNSFNPYSNVLKEVDLSPAGARSFDGHKSIPVNVGVPHIGKILPTPEEPPVAHHIRFSRPSSTLGDEFTQFCNSESPFRDMLNGSLPQETTPSYHPSTPPVLRSNSVLHSQVRKMQINLDSKDNEIRKLKQQRTAIGSPEYGTLSEQLREKTRELEKWKKRAEAAEKQLEIFARIQPRRAASNQFSDAVGNMYQPSPDPIERTMANGKSSIGRAMDGAKGSWDSEHSNGTVLRESLDILSDEAEDEAQHRMLQLWTTQTEKSLKNARYLMDTKKGLETERH